MSKFIKRILLALALLFFLAPIFVFAQNNISEDIFKAEVTGILEEREQVGDDGLVLLQQKVELESLEGDLKGKKIIFDGLNEFEVVFSHQYKAGDKVLVSRTQNFEGRDIFYIIDYVRTGKIYFILAVFILCVIIIARWQGVKSLISLAISFLIILYFIIPILVGSNPLLISIIGGVGISIAMIYITYGFNKKSSIINLAFIFSVLLTAFLSLIFTNLTKLSGLAGEESMYLISLGQNVINLKGLLLAGIIIGTIGVLDDVIVSQVSTVEQLKKANPSLSVKEIYHRAKKVGTDHISSMVNTLFFAYAGASLPLLILFSLKQEPFLAFNQIISNEIIAVEIVRALVGGISLILAVPIANYLASYLLKIKSYK